MEQGTSLLMEWTQYMVVGASQRPLCIAKVPQRKEGTGKNLRLGLGK